MSRHALLLLCLATAGATAAELRLDERGAWQVTGEGLPSVNGSLFLWHDQWKYEVPQQVKREGEALTGWLTGASTGAKVFFRVAAQPEPDKLTLQYVFRREAGTRLSNGVLLLLSLPLEPVAQRTIRFTHSPAARIGDGFSGVGRGFDLNLTDQQALTLRADRIVEMTRRSDQPKAVAINVRLLPGSFPADVDVPVTVTVALTPAGADRLPWSLSMAKPLALSAQAAAVTVPVNTTATIEAVLEATYDNPFDPEQVKLDAEVGCPDDTTLWIPGYYHQDYRAERVDEVELLAEQGPPGWRVRFTPTLPGTYRVVLSARDRSGTCRSGPVLITATPSEAQGMLRIGRHANAFVRQPGGSVFLIGHNVPTYLAGKQSMAEAFDKMAAGGENFNRFWMYSARMGLEWGQPVGTYRLPEAWRLDHAFELARQRGINLLLCFDTHQDFQGDRLKANPYHLERGGPISTPLEFFTNEAARKLYRQRLRYIIARWSHCTNLVAWEFVNEIEGWAGFTEHQDQVAAWHSEMAAYLKANDPYQHPVTTSCWTSEGWPTLWNAPGLDLVQTHHYSNAKVDMAQRTIDYCRQKRRAYPGRLHLFGEMGIHYKFGAGQGDDEDPTGLHLHKQNWAALLSGCASVPANWWHESYFEPRNLYPRFRGIAAFARELDLDRPWQPLEDLKVSWVTPPAEPVRRDLEFSGAANAWRPLPVEARYQLRRDGTVGNREHLPGLLHGASHQDVKVAWTFEVDLPEAGTMVVLVERASNNPRLVAEVDGRVVVDRPFPTAEGMGKESVFRPQWKIWETVYHEEVIIPIGAGKHLVTLRNEGGDWLAVGGLRLPRYVVDPAPPAQALAMSDGRELIAWVRNLNHWWRPVAEGQPIVPVPPVVVSLPPLPAGRYRLETWDTYEGKVTATRSLTLTAAPGSLELPAIDTDLAVRLRPEG